MRPPARRRLPGLVAHADWSTDPRKRWMATGRLVGATYELDRPENVAQASALLPALDRRTPRGSPFLVGFDFPIGFPAAYAKTAGIERFLDEFPRLGTGRWKKFYDVAAEPTEISAVRPFYPLRPGGTSHAHVTAGLRVAAMADLLRVCERGEGRRRDASVMFWTLGGKQVGRAAIAGWREVIDPALRQAGFRVAIWPFHGTLEHLLQTARCVVVEAYPAEACLHLELTPPGHGWSKRRQADRRRQAEGMLAWAWRRGVVLTKGLRAAIRDGFGVSESGEDPFDAVLGVMSMVEVVLGHRSDGAPADHLIRDVEGWIFGRPAHQQIIAGRPCAKGARR